MGLLTKKYQWAIDRLKEELPRWEIKSEEFDWGGSLAVAGRLKGRKKNKRQQGFMLEVSQLAKRFWGAPNAPYSLNKDPKKKRVLNQIIRRFKELEKT